MKQNQEELKELRRIREEVKKGYEGDKRDSRRDIGMRVWVISEDSDINVPTEEDATEINLDIPSLDLNDDYRIMVEALIDGSVIYGDNAKRRLNHEDIKGLEDVYVKFNNDSKVVLDWIRENIDAYASIGYYREVGGFFPEHIFLSEDEAKDYYDKNNMGKSNLYRIKKEYLNKDSSLSKLLRWVRDSEEGFGYEEEELERE